MAEEDIGQSTLDELDAEPALILKAKNFFGAEREFRFFEVHFEYRNFFGKRTEIPYTSITGVRCKEGNVYIKLEHRIFPIILRGQQDVETTCLQIRGLAGIKEKSGSFSK
jgi:hypothetical protein